VQQVGVLGLKVYDANHNFIPMVTRGYLPDETMTERAFRDFYIGIITGDNVRLLDGYRALVAVAHRVGKGLADPLILDHAPNMEDAARDVTLLLAMIPANERPGHYRHFGRHVRQILVDERRKRKSAQLQETRREKVCEMCGKGFTSIRRDAKYCSPACRQRAKRAVTDKCV
jgi:hypothetical protein